MAETQQVIIEFLTETSQLDSAIDQLEKTGAIDSKMASAFKQTNAEINKQSSEIKKAAASTAPLKKNLEDVNKATKKFTQDFMTGFNEGVIETLKDAGVSAEEFANALGSGQTEVEKSSESLRARLKTLTQQIAEMKLAGQDGTEQFKALVIEAGNIKDAMGDAAAEIKNAGSDTRTFDNLLGAAQAVAGGFAVAQGTAALFGDENEELQKTLLKVNALMAVLQGLQSIGNAVQKEGAVIQLFSNGQRIIGNAQLAVENGLQSTSIVVRLGAAAAQRVLNAAMAANPILIFVSALILVVTAMAAYIKSSKEAEIQTGDLNAAVEAATEGFENYALQIKQQSEKATSELEKNGALQSDILKAQLKTEQTIDAKRRQEIARLRQFLTTSRDADEKAIKAATDRIAQLAKDSNEFETKQQIDQNNIKKQLREEDIKGQIAAAETALILAKKGSQRQFQLQKQLIDLRATQELNAAGLTEEEKTNILVKAAKQRSDLELKSITASADARSILATKNSEEELNARINAIKAAANEELANVNLTEGERAKISARTQKEINDLIFDYEKAQLVNAKAAIDARLVNVKEGTKDELNLRTDQAKIEAEIELKEQGLSAEKRLLIEAQLLKKIQQLRVDFFNKLSKDVLTIEQRGNEARIADLKTSDQERLDLQMENIEIERVIQLSAAKGNAAEEIRINAEAEQKKLQLRKNAIDEALNYELSVTESRNGKFKRAFEAIAGDERKSLKQRVNAINQLAAKEIESINKRQDALEEQHRQGLISEKDYIAQKEKLADDEEKAIESRNQRIIQLDDEAKKRRIQNAIDTASQVLDIISQFGQQQTEAEQIKIDSQRAEIEQLREAGTITEQEAKARQKKLDIEESKLKRKQAERDKAIAIFQAVINTAAAIARALATGGPILAAVVGALGAAQIALIASRPIPKFAKGKKDRYEGPGEIGEAGMELMQHDGQLYLAKKRTLVWLGKDDKVYNPTETKEMLMPVVDKQLMQWQAPVEKQIDMKQMAAELAKEIKKIPGTNVSIDENGLKVWVQEGLSRKNYMDKRYSSK